MAGSAGNLITSAGTWTFGTTTTPYGNLILVNGQSAAGGSAVELEVANQGHLYADNSQGQWWQWNGSGWGASAAPSTTTAPTTQIDISGHSAAAAPLSDLILPSSWGDKDATFDHTFTFADVSEFGRVHYAEPSASISLSAASNPTTHDATSNLSSLVQLPAATDFLTWEKISGHL